MSIIGVEEFSMIVEAMKANKRNFVRNAMNSLLGALDKGVLD